MKQWREDNKTQKKDDKYRKVKKGKQQLKKDKYGIHSK